MVEMYPVSYGSVLQGFKGSKKIFSNSCIKWLIEWQDYKICDPV